MLIFSNILSVIFTFLASYRQKNEKHPGSYRQSDLDRDMKYQLFNIFNH